MPFSKDAAALRRQRDAAVAERDKLGALLLKRNREAALLYDKAAALTAALHQGHAAYRQRQADIRVLKIKVVVANVLCASSCHLRETICN